MASRMLSQGGLVIAAALLVGACSGAPAAISPPITVPSIPPTTLSSLPVDIPSFEIPSFQIPSFAIPSFTSDPVLAAAFPAEIDGEPLTNVSATNFMAVMTVLEAEPEDISRFVTGMQGLGIDPTAVSYGSATAKVDGSSVGLQVLRFPGANAAGTLAVLVSLDDAAAVPTFTTETIGGKTVTVSTSDDGVEYYYFNGEFAWFLPSAEPEQAAAVFAALP